MVRNETPTLALGLLAFCGGVTVLMVAFALSLNFESTPETVADLVKGRWIAVPGVIALVAGVVALNARRRSWALAVSGVGAVAAIVAVLLTLLLPGG